MEKTYNPQQIEQTWSKLWEDQSLAKPSGSNQPYCIMLPPPNVTGTLHMGHGFQQTLMDALIRYHRMQGEQTLWQAGTDHAGIATQMVVERQLLQEGSSRHDLGREKFVDRVWDWKEQSGATITQQMRRLGVSIDWSRECFSMDEKMSHATREAFIRLHKEGLIYRGKRLVNWDPKLQTAISDLEVETVESQGHLWYIRYPLSNGEGHLTVATTRPETMLGDAAVAVHPDDERFKHLIGQTVNLPLTDRKIPIIADDHVEREFGTGCVKITPAHDFNDNEMGKRHNLPLINIMTPTAHLNEDVPESYQGLERYVARKKIISDLEQLGLLEKIEDHKLSVPKGDRSGVVIEPMLTDQWFLKMKSIANAAIEALNQGEIRFVPESWGKTYLQWLENIEDWCISRQLWWGHQIPAWYDDEGNHYVGHDANDIIERYKLANTTELTQETDVLDTWFTASLWPFASLGWPEHTPDYTTFHPSQVLVTGFDIIFFWVARMVMMGIKLTGQVPFKEIYITGLIRDSHGQKMSKSKGNIIDPIDLIDGIELATLTEKRTKSLMQPKMAKAIVRQTQKDFPKGIAAHGTDALRFTYCALATTGRDINLDMGRIDGYRNFCNKLWNAARYVIMNTEGEDLHMEKAIEHNLADNWIRSRLQSVIEQAHHHFKHYRFDLLAQTLYEFTWNEYCDWYLELAKCTLSNKEANSAQLRGTRITLLEVLETILCLLHPIIPFITEEIHQQISSMLGMDKKSLMVTNYPTSNVKAKDSKAEETTAWLKQVIVAIRTVRAEMDISPAKKIPVIFYKGSAQDHSNVDTCQHYIQTLAKTTGMSWAQDHAELDATATQVVNSLEIHIPLSGLIDKSAELSRLTKEMDKLKKELEKSDVKLKNPNFAERAPKVIVDKEKENRQQLLSTLKKLEEQHKNISTLTPAT